MQKRTFTQANIASPLSPVLSRRYDVYQVEDTWFLQTLAIVLSILSIGAYYDNKSIFDWNGVTLNAVVAVLAAITKALLEFAISDCLGQSKWIWFSWQQRPLKDLDLIESASRGPLGSLKLLQRPMGRSFINLGTIVIILTVAIDPFVHLNFGQKERTHWSTKMTRLHRLHVHRDIPKGSMPH